MIPAASISPLRQSLIADMTMRCFSAETQRIYLRNIAPEMPYSSLAAA